MRQLARDGVAIAYEVSGRESALEPLLLTHGYGATSAMWEPNVAALGSDRLVVRWDMRGHGASDAPDDPSAYGHDACIADMLALLDAVGASRAVLVGMSLGGFLSLALCAREPQRVAKLVLVDTGPGYRDESARAGWNEWARALGDDLDARGAGALPSSTEALAAEHREGARGLAHAARGMLTQHSGEVIEALGAVAVPVLVVVGEHDAPFRGAASYMAARIPDAREVVIAGAGHAANMDRPDEFNAVVGEFL